MTKVKNISGDAIGYSGLTFEPDQVQDVSHDQAEAMAASNPAKFQIMPEPVAARLATPTPKNSQKPRVPK